MRTFRDAKAMAKAMRERLAGRGVDISHSEALEIVARQFGVESWNVLSAKIDRDVTAGSALAPAIPIFRIFDEAKAREFYVGFLRCSIDWEHRFSPDAPLYCQVSRGALVLHLSEHSGDASPGGNAVAFTTGVEALQKELLERDYKYNRPGLERQDWGLEMQVTDPFGNRLRFIERQK